MRTERTFLMELFLEDSLPKEIKIRIKDRFQELEETPPAFQLQRPVVQTITGDPVVATQSPSMQRLMANNPDLIPRVAAPVTPAAAQALAARQALINTAMKEKPEDGRSAKRKI